MQCMLHSGSSWHSTTSCRWAHPQMLPYDTSVHVACIIHLAPCSIYHVHLCSHLIPPSVHVGTLPTPLEPSLFIPHGPSVRVGTPHAHPLELSAFTPHAPSVCVGTPHAHTVLEPVKTLVLRYNTSVVNCVVKLRLVSVSNFYCNAGPNSCNNYSS